MKKLKIISLITLVAMLIAISNVAFAYGDYCHETEDGEHFFSSAVYNTVHPHKGSLMCCCGEEVSRDSLYIWDCQACQMELCEKGIHYYAANIYYTDEKGYSAVGVCYCGAEKKFCYSVGNDHSEPYPGVVKTAGGYLHSVKHPHYEYFSNGQPIMDEGLPCGPTYMTACDICQYLNEYGLEVECYQSDIVKGSYKSSPGSYCDVGIHAYFENVHYDTMFSGYGECYCGKRKYFTSYNDGYQLYEPYPGITSVVNYGVETFIEVNHPHREYDPYTGTLSYNSEYDGNIGNCGVCEFMREYESQIADYEASSNNNYDNSHYNYYDDYYTNEYENTFTNDYYNNYAAEEYYYDDYEEEAEEDKEFFKWLEIAKEILNE